MRRPWLLIGGISAAVVVAHIVSFGGQEPQRFGELMNVLHVFGFLILTLLLLPLALRLAPERRVQPAVAVVAALAFIALLATVSEAAQVFVPRDASVGDLLRDAGGITAGALLTAAIRGHYRVATAILAIVPLAIVLNEPGRVLIAMAQAEYRMPALIGFESTLDPLLYSSVNATIIPASAGPGWPLAGKLVDVRAHKGNAGISFDRLPRNWSSYSALSFLIAPYGDGTSFVTIRIHDSRHNNRYDDRFNRRLEIGPGPRRIRIPLGDVRAGPRQRALDLPHVEGVIIFVDTAQSDGFLLDDLRLE